VSGLAYVGFAARGLLPGADAKWARSFFFASMPHLVLVMTTLVLTVD
jgi:heme O synthase-like polyprenyltransferase